MMGIDVSYHLCTTSTQHNAYHKDPNTCPLDNGVAETTTILHDGLFQKMKGEELVSLVFQTGLALFHCTFETANTELSFSSVSSYSSRRTSSEERSLNGPILQTQTKTMGL